MQGAYRFKLDDVVKVSGPETLECSECHSVWMGIRRYARFCKGAGECTAGSHEVYTIDSC